MKRLLLIVLPLLIMVGCSKPVPINYEETLIVRGNGLYYTKDTNKPYSGPVFSLNEVGKYKSKGFIENGVGVEVWTYFDNNGDSIETDMLPLEYFEMIRKSEVKHFEMIRKFEVSSEDAVINYIVVALENYAQNKMLSEGRRYWPNNPFDALVKKPKSYSLEGTPCDEDNEWTFVVDANDDAFTGYISHQRTDNSRFQWNYNKGINTGTDNDVTGVLYQRTELGIGGTVVLYR